MSEVKVFVEQTPNPESLKFVVNKLLINGNKDFPNPESAKDIPFVKELFEFSFVREVFIASNFITINKVKEIGWEDIKDILVKFIKSSLEAGVVIDPADANQSDNPTFEGTGTEQKIQQILHEYIQPAIEQDGGAINFKSFDEGIVTVELRGACSGCPSSTLTLKSGIENLLTRMVPEVKEVVSEAV